MVTDYYLLLLCLTWKLATVDDIGKKTSLLGDFAKKMKGGGGVGGGVGGVGGGVGGVGGGVDGLVRKASVVPTSSSHSGTI